MASVYIIYSEKLDRYYIGVTQNLEERIKKHNRNNRGFTGKAIDWELQHQEVFETKTEALRREKEITNWKSRQMIEQLINNNTL